MGDGLAAGHLALRAPTSTESLVIAVHRRTCRSSPARRHPFRGAELAPKVCSIFRPFDGKRRHVGMVTHSRVAGMTAAKTVMIKRALSGVVWWSPWAPWPSWRLLQPPAVRGQAAEPGRGRAGLRGHHGSAHRQRHRGRQPDRRSLERRPDLPGQAGGDSIGARVHHVCGVLLRRRRAVPADRRRARGAMSGRRRYARPARRLRHAVDAARVRSTAEGRRLPRGDVPSAGSLVSSAEQQRTHPCVSWTAARSTAARGSAQRTGTGGTRHWRDTACGSRAGRTTCRARSRELARGRESSGGDRYFRSAGGGRWPRAGIKSPPPAAATRVHDFPPRIAPPSAGYLTNPYFLPDDHGGPLWRGAAASGGRAPPGSDHK